MADTEFEELRQNLDALPTFRKAPAPFYSLVADVDLDEDTPSSKSDASSDHEEDGPLSVSDGTSAESVLKGTPSKTQQIIQTISTISSGSSSTAEDDEIGDGLRTVTLGPARQSSIGHGVVPEDELLVVSAGSGPESLLQLQLTQLEAAKATIPGAGGPPEHVEVPVVEALGHAAPVACSGAALARTSSLPWIPGQVERRRRKLPEIPKNRKSSVLQVLAGQTSLADELNASHRRPPSHYPHAPQQHPHTGATSATFFKQSSLLALKCSYLLDEDSSPDSERLQSLGDVDSGHSTAHSPNDYKSMSPPPPPLQAASPVTSPFPPPYGGVPFSQLEMLEATHRALHKFVPRHHDEIELEIGDPVYVQKEAEDLWCEGVNLRTGRQGIFPSAYVVDLDYNDFDPTSVEMKRERYLLGYLGSVETMAHKGTGVVCQAVRKIVGTGSESPKAQPCILEISDQGLRMVDRSRNKKSKGPCIDYFYSLKNVSFCAFHPRDHRYIGFITKHPTVQRFACHVFQGTESTRPVAEAVGRAFQRFYQKFIETAYPIEDIYID
ncbi:JNK-interacting protein 1 [Anopheles nili]|uniref:JNK-interacting protein 1 n=1 Tax=Anopheles nili TaxID=185578 RepID=UPI00237BA18C|nr:JNK-interacting protein 1 [Anopheles nili]